MRRYRLNLLAGVTQSLSVKGDYLRVVSSDEEITIDIDGEALQGMEKGMSYRGDQPFNKLKLISQVNQQVEVMAGSGKVEDNRATISGTVDVSGVVDVIDGGRIIVNDDLAFAGTIASPAVVSKYSFAQVFNPVNSGVNLIIEFVRAGTEKTCSVGVFLNNSAFLTLDPGQPVNKKAGGRDSVAEIRAESSATVNPVDARFMSIINLQAGSNDSHIFSKPVVLSPGSGLSVRSDLVENRIGASFEFYEEVI